MFSTLLQLVLSNYGSFNCVKHEKVEKKIESLSKKYEELKKSFKDNENLENLLSTKQDINGLETAKKLDNVLMLGLKIGLELGVYLPEIDIIKS